MASVENIRELNTTVTGIDSQQVTPEPERTPEAPVATSPSPQSRLTPAPVPESNPWSRQAKPHTLAQGPFEAFSPQNIINSSNFPAGKRTTGKEKWMPYTPVVNSSANAGSSPSTSSGNSSRRGGDSGRSKQRKQRAAKTPEPSTPGEKESSPSPNGEKFKRQPRRKFVQQPQVQTPYDMALSLLVQQFDYYFSIDNLLKDIFLRKQMNSKGYIPIQVIADFNRVRILSNGDVNLVTEALNWCPATEVQGSKVRLQEGWERWIFPVEERDAAGRADSDSDDEAPKFHIDKAVPFVPKRSQ